MPPVVHLILVVIALVCFGLSYRSASGPEPSWRQLISIGLTAMVASFISW